MKITMTISTLLMASMLVLSGCAADDEEDIMGELLVSVMFMNDYAVTDSMASMIMAYAWDMASWSSGPSGASTSTAVDGMFMDVSVSPNAPDTLSGMHEVMLKSLPAGTYYVGVYESSQMNYDATKATLIGYYNSNDATTMMTMMTMMAGSATSVTISTTTPVELELMMAMPMMGGM